MKQIYLDNGATTPLCDAAKAKIVDAMETFGNPSSLHPAGQAARKLVDDARREVAATLGVRGPVRPEQLIFTSCGSEADNLAIFGTAYAKERRRGGRIITTDSEHSGVEKAMQALEADGFEIIRIPTRGGELDWNAYQNALNARTFLVSIMMTNNETGAMYDLKRAFALAKAQNPDIVTHTDAVQGYLKCRFTPEAIKADLVTVSGHKIHAPKGVGALYVRRGILLQNLIEGGAQERGKRAGTENIPGIMGLAAALKDACENMDKNAEKVTAMRDKLIAGLSQIPHCALNGDPVNRLPGNVSFCFEGIEGESLLLYLDAMGVAASSGSACTSGSLDPSHVLLAIGRVHDVAHGSLRLSLCHYNTEQEIEHILQCVPKVVQSLRNMSPVWRDLQTGKREYIL